MRTLLATIAVLFGYGAAFTLAAEGTLWLSGTLPAPGSKVDVPRSVYDRMTAVQRVRAKAYAKANGIKWRIVEDK